MDNYFDRFDEEPARPAPEELFKRNAPYAVEGNYQTQLDPQSEVEFHDWVAKNNVPFDPSPTADYDMRGFFQAQKAGDPAATTGQNQNDGKLHFSDAFKTPYHESFSRESRYAQPNAPSWNDKSQLIDQQGNVVYDEVAANRPAGNFFDQFDAKPQDSGPIGRGWQSIQRGVKGLESLGYGVAALGADAVGADGVKDQMLQGYQEKSKEAEALASDVPSYKDIRTDGVGNFLTDAGKYAVDAVFENLPMFLPSLVTGGIGAAVARRGAQALVEKTIATKVAEMAAKGMVGEEAQALAEKAAADEVGKIIAKRTAVGAAAGAYPSSAGMEAGSIYGDIYDDTGEGHPGLAAAGGLAAGALDVLPQVAALKHALGPAADQAMGSLIKRLGVSGAKMFFEEAGTEGLQSVIEQATAMQANPNRAFNWDDVWDSALKGGGAGIVLGGGAEGVNAFRNRNLPKTDSSSTPQTDEAIRQLYLKGLNDQLDAALSSDMEGGASGPNAPPPGGGTAAPMIVTPEGDVLPAGGVDGMDAGTRAGYEASAVAQRTGPDTTAADQERFQGEGGAQPQQPARAQAPVYVAPTGEASADQESLTSVGTGVGKLQAAIAQAQPGSPISFGQVQRVTGIKNRSDLRNLIGTLVGQGVLQPAQTGWLIMKPIQSETAQGPSSRPNAAPAAKPTGVRAQPQPSTAAAATPVPAAAGETQQKAADIVGHLRNEGWTDPEILNYSRSLAANGETSPDARADAAAMAQHLSAEAGKVVGTTKERTISESTATLKEQQKALIEGRQAVQMFPTGTEPLDLPPGMKQVTTARGVFHFNPEKIQAPAIRRASSAGRENEILGMGRLSKADVAASGEQPVSVVERTPSGGEVRTALTTPTNAGDTKALLEKNAAPGNIVTVENPDKVIDERIAAAGTTEESPNDQTKGDGTRQAPAHVNAETDLARARERVAEPTEAQKEAGNYQKGHLKWYGLDIAIETGKGQERTGTKPDGSKWSVTMPHDYGYIKRTTGADGEHVDVNVGPNTNSRRVFVIDQRDLGTGKFDEHKVMVGFPTARDATTAYEGGFSDGKGTDRIGAVTEMNVGEFKKWLKSGNMKRAVGKFRSTAQQAAATKRTTGPKSLLQFIASHKTAEGKRGMYESSGELKSRDIVNHFEPGYGKPFTLNKDTGISPDDMRESAITAGYLPKGSSVEDLMAAIDNEIAGTKKYAEHEVSAAKDRTDSRAAAEDQSQHTDRLAELAKEAGDNVFSPADLDEASRLMAANGLTALQALDEVVRRQERAFAEEPGDVPFTPDQETFDGHDPFELQADEAVQPPEAGGRADERGQDGEAAGEEAQPDRARPQAEGHDEAAGEPRDLTPYDENLKAAKEVADLLGMTPGGSEDGVYFKKSADDKGFVKIRAHHKGVAVSFNVKDPHTGSVGRVEQIPSGFKFKDDIIKQVRDFMPLAGVEPTVGGKAPALGPRENSWVVVKKGTLEAVTETFQPKIADAINLAKYDVLTSGDYLARKNAELKAAKEKPASEKIDTADGKRDQLVIPGAERSAKQAAAAQPERIKGTKPQQGAADDGLFGEGHKQNEMFSAVGKKDQPDLVIHHNISASNLMHAARMGGIPVPSLAITKADQSITGYGEITLIGPKEMADPKGYARTQVFGSDIYSPRYPEINYKLDKPALKKLNDLLAPYRGPEERETYGGEIGRPDDLVQRDAFKKYADEKLGKNAGFHDMKALAEETLREVGAGERLFQGFDYNGNRRYKAHTLENVVRILKKEMRGGEGFNYGVGSLRAHFTPRFRSIAQIKKASGRLLDSDKFKAVKEEIDKEFWTVVEALQPYSDRSDKFGFGDTVIHVMEDAAKMGIPRALKEYQFEDVGEDAQKAMAEFMGKLRNLPTEYFEAKIPREVQLQEFAGAVVPHDVDPKVTAMLERHGIAVSTYKRSDETDRRRAVKEAAGELKTLFASPGYRSGSDHATETSTRKDVEAKVTEIVNQVSGGRAKVQFEDSIHGEGEAAADSGADTTDRQEMAGAYNPATRLLRVSMSGVADPIKTGLHEVFHDLQSWGTFDRSERKALDTSVDRMKAIARKEGLNDATMTQRELEAVAYAYTERKRLAGEKVAGLLPGVIRAFAKVRDILARIKAFATGKGWTTMEDVFGRATSGEIAARGDSVENFLDEANGTNKVDSPEFKRWFGKSKVVDKEGRPLRVYHGTTSDIGQFDPSKSRVVGSEFGSFFTPDPDTASRYAGFDENFPSSEAGGNVMPVYLSLQNPLIVDFKGDKYGRPDAIKRALAGGHDGVILRNHYDVGGVQDQYVAFRPAQIKSAMNSGTFDATDPRIQYSAAITDASEKFEAANEDEVGANFRKFRATLVRRQDEFKAKYGDKFPGATRAFQAMVDYLDERGIQGYVHSEFTALNDKLERIGETMQANANKGLGGNVSSISDKEQYSVPTLEKEARPVFSKDQGKDIRSAATIAISKRIRQDTTEVPIWQRARQAVREFKETGAKAVLQGLADSFYAVSDLERTQNESKLLDASKSAYKAVRMTQNLGSVMSYILNHGPIEMKRVDENNADAGGWFAPVEKHNFKGGFQGIFTNVLKKGEIELFKDWIIAQRAGRLLGEGRENLLTADEIAAIKAEVSKDTARQARFSEAFGKYQDFNGKMLGMAVAAGRVSQKQADFWQSTGDYVPFYRMMEGDDAAQGPVKAGGFSQSGKLSKELKGGAQQLGDPIENMVMNMTSMVDKAMKNEALRRVIDMGVDAGMIMPAAAEENVTYTADQIEGMLEKNGINLAALSEAEQDKWIKMMSAMVHPPGDAVTVWRDGQPERYHIYDPMLLRAISSMQPHQFGNLMTLMRASKRLLTEGVTMSPAFMAANFLRDTLSTWAISGQKGLNPIKDAPAGLLKAWKKDPSLLAIQASGGGTAGFYGTQPTDVRKQIDDKLAGVDKSRVVDTVKKAWELWHRVGQATEQANRIAIHDQVKKNGGTDAEAAFQALDLLDFTQRGDYAAVRVLTEMIPFLNARIQGLYRMYRGAVKGAPDSPQGVQKQFLFAGSMIMGATLALAFANSNNPDYDALEDWDKDTYWHFWLGKDHWRIPKPFEVGSLFGMLPERAFRLMMGQDTSKKSAEAIGRMFVNTFAVDVRPQLLKPMIESWANKDSFTGNNIIPPGMKELLPEAQYSSYTSETARILGRAIPKTVGDLTEEGLGFNLKSPLILDHLIRGYLGELGTYVTEGSDAMARLTGDFAVKPATRVSDLPVITRFYRGNDPRTQRFVQEFYDTRQQVEAVAQTIRRYGMQGDIAHAKELLDENRDKLAMRGGLNAAYKAMTQTTAMMRQVQDSRTMDGDKKREMIDKLTAQRNKIAKMAVQHAPATSALVKRMEGNAAANRKLEQFTGDSP